MEGVGQFTLGQDFFSAARFLFEGTKNDDLNFRHSGPVEYMYAHALEPMLKGGLQFFGQPTDRSHNLHRLYDLAKQNASLSQRVATTEIAVKQHWREFLREARDAPSAKLKSYGISDPSLLWELGSFDNATIGENLPSMVRAVIWLGDRHTDDGGQFRYFKEGLDRRKVVHAFGLNEDVVLRTLDWGCEGLSGQFEDLIRQELRGRHP